MYFDWEHFLNLNINGTETTSVGSARAGWMHSPSSPCQVEALLNAFSKGPMVGNKYVVASLLERLWVTAFKVPPRLSPHMWNTSNAEVLDLNNFLWQGVPQWIVFAYPSFLASFPLVSFSLILVLWNVRKTSFNCFCHVPFQIVLVSISLKLCIFFILTF